MFASGASKKKIRLFKIEKNQQQKTISATKIILKKLCFGDFRGGGRAPGAPPLESTSAVDEENELWTLN